MQFNRFIFDNYLATDEGKKAVRFFTDFENVLKHKKKSAYFDFLNHIGILPTNKNDSDDELKRFSTLFSAFDFLGSYSDDEEIFQIYGLEGVIENEKRFIEEKIASSSNYSERDFMTFVR